MQPAAGISDHPTGQTGPGRHVLVVDDSRLQRKILSASLGRWGFRVSEAASGIEALRICRSDPPDLVLSDWMMPGMDGLEFCQEFRRLPREDYGYFILLTSKSDKGEVARGLDNGADDFLTKPVNGHELRARISAGERILHMQRELTEKNRLIGDTLAELQRLYDAIDKDLLQAKKIQESLVPVVSRDFGASHVGLLLKPCGHVGGDLVGMFSADDARIGLYCIDVSGHGITSALMTARVSGYLSSDFPDQNVAMQRGADGFTLRPPDEVARLLNERLSVDQGVVEYFTMAYASIDLATGHARLVQAGHPHPLLLHADGRREFLGRGGMPIGLVPGASYSMIETQLAPGDRLLLYSDGITECRVRGGGMLEEAGLLDLIDACEPRARGREFLDDLFWQLNSVMAGDQSLDDDVSAAIFEYGG